MPIQPTYPGVYVQEVSSGVRTITGVSTSIGAFFGRSQKGPINKATRCLSYADFLRLFGGPHPQSDLAASVQQFFLNGGTDCYVVRLAKDPKSAAITLRNVASTTTMKSVLTATAKAPGLWGQNLKLAIDYNTTNPDDTFNLTVTNEVGNAVVDSETHYNLSMNPQSPKFAPAFVTQSSKLINLTLHGDMQAASGSTIFIHDVANTPLGVSQSRRVFSGADVAGVVTAMAAAMTALVITPTQMADKKSKFILNMDGKPENDIEVDLNGITLPATFTAPSDLTAPLKTVIDVAASAKLGAGVAVTVSVDVVTTSATTSFGVLRIASADTNTVVKAPNVTIRSAPARDFAAPMLLGLDNGGIEVGRYANMRPAPNGIFFSGGNFNDLTNGTNGLDAFAVLAQNAMTALVFDGATATPINVNLVTGSATSANFLDATGGFAGLREKLRRIQDAVNANPNSPYTAELWGYRLAFKRKTGPPNTSGSVAATGATNFSGGFTRNIRKYSLGNLTTSPFELSGVANSTGDDGGAPDQVVYEGDPIKHTGFYALDKADLFNLMVLPGDRDYDVANVRAAASAYCESRRAFLLLDAPANWTGDDYPVADAATVNSFRIGVSKQHSAIFYPRIQYSEAGVKKYMGASGMIAGIMARTDAQRGVWKAPAGLDADLRGLTDVEVSLTDAENGVLNKLGVNCLRKFPNGVVSWGARTLDGNDDFGSEWKYIPIRRLALFLEESLFRGTTWVVFEPNDEPLWAKVRMNLTAFMLGLFNQGAFQGSTPDRAFFVKCDGETTSANDRNLGIVNIQVGFAPLKPAEFVIITIQQIPDLV